VYFLLLVCLLVHFFGKNKATAILFKIKDRAFNGGKNDIDSLHKYILQYSMRRPHKAATWNLDGQALSLSPKFEFNAPASIRVVLGKSQLSINHDPIFHRAGALA
jgi:hypothetical protein